MKHTASIATATLVLDHVLSTPLYRQLYERVRGAILMGQLTAGTRLPSTRALARELGVARNTVMLAYGQLLAEGYLTLGRVPPGPSSEVDCLDANGDTSRAFSMILRESFSGLGPESACIFSSFTAASLAFFSFLTQPGRQTCPG